MLYVHLYRTSKSHRTKIEKTLNLSVFSLLSSELVRYVNFVHIVLLVAGLEPARCCHRGILSPLRLPIPPHQLTQ